jgi:hypothetical protein
MRLDFTVQAFDLKQMPAVDYAAGEGALQVGQAVQIFDFQAGPSRWGTASEPTNQLVLWPPGVSDLASNRAQGAGSGGIEFFRCPDGAAMNTSGCTVVVSVLRRMIAPDVVPRIIRTGARSNGCYCQ